ncbi:hypothetical protein ON010_g8252 [Phytophthora cinnamomi]|nr:hypothetical protein ON010_g8252 [Phytophthora cinnamomi]
MIYSAVVVADSGRLQEDAHGQWYEIAWQVYLPIVQQALMSWTLGYPAQWTRDSRRVTAASSCVKFLSSVTSASPRIKHSAPSSIPRARRLGARISAYLRRPSMATAAVAAACEPGAETLRVGDSN